MNRWKIVASVACLACLAQGAWLLAPHLVDVALAQDDTTEQAPGPGEAAEEPARAASPRLHCRLFVTEVTHGADIDTGDRTTEIGQWVGDQEDDGWLLYGVDFEVGQKSTGYPNAFVHVCVYPG